MYRVQFRFLSFENYERKYFQNVLCLCDHLVLFHRQDKIGITYLI